MWEKEKQSRDRRLEMPEERVGMILERKAPGEIQVTLWVQFCCQVFGVLNK